MTYEIKYEKIVSKKHLPKLSASVKSRIKSAIETKLTKDPFFFGKPLKHRLHNQYSLRLGDYRIIYTIRESENLVIVHAIGHRKNIYH